MVVCVGADTFACVCYYVGWSQLDVWQRRTRKACVCVRERVCQRESKRESERERERERERKKLGNSQT